ncbi:MAG: NAD-specific glutamate dehydrogenase [bacterium ADurb.Bin425]|nr:MAG: NAD-specific glutamate dehydrogenase [bacterium ADurb.Bin425]
MFHRLAQLLDQVSGELIELGSSQFHVEVFGTGFVGGDEGQRDCGLVDGRKLDFGFLGSFGQSLQSLGIFGQIYTFALLEFLGKPLHQLVVKVVTAKVGITSG